MGAAYIGTLSSNLPFGRDVNYPVVTPTATSAGANILARRPNPLFGAVLVLNSDQNASYHGLQITSTMRMSHHVSFNAFYTFSHTNSSVQLHNNTTQGLAQNYSKLEEDEGRADTDQRHVFSMSLNYQPDYYTGKNGFIRGVVNGWSISPIIKLRSGLPFTITNGNVDANLDGSTNDRAQLIGDPHRASNRPTVVQHGRLCAEQSRDRGGHRRQLAAQPAGRSELSRCGSGALATSALASASSCASAPRARTFSTS